MQRPKLFRQLTGLRDDVDDVDDELDPIFDEAKESDAFPLVESAESQPKTKLMFRFGGVTDVGGGKVNQDEMFFLEASNRPQSYVMGVLDGHGKELGQLAAQVTRDVFEKAFGEDTVYDDILTNARESFSKIFNDAHMAIKNTFIEYYRSTGWEVVASDCGKYLMKRKSGRWSCIHGGTTATVVAIIDGQKMISANCGDSGVLMCGVASPISCDFADSPPSTTPIECKPLPPSTFNEFSFSTSLFTHLSADHSPESFSEFDRIRRFRHQMENGNIPEAMFVYDSMKVFKSRCKSIFETDVHGIPRKTNNGGYYKNVRDEWASFVATPPHAKFQDALAFTRSLGDFHLHTYGVSCEPDVFVCDLTQGDWANDKSAAVIVASDGVWDNWTFEEINTYLLDPEFAKKARDSVNAQAVAEDLLTENLQRAFRNFGTQADNMTAVLCYIVAEDVEEEEC
eukprot:TRINITY_DN7393_c0_g1_i1.p1 TRINITY_DN7393_c0_g1~~TRINITY_DN7393_c0_g1_i1.p1  ORF type:complete len:454 (-),score=130.42 TRINITY_DN7393_c0_g1_i1:783-2144(-)